MPPVTIPAPSTCGKFRPSVGFKMSDTNMLVGQTAIQVSSAIFHRGGTLSFFDERLAEFIPSPFQRSLAQVRPHRAEHSRYDDAFSPVALPRTSLRFAEVD